MAHVIVPIDEHELTLRIRIAKEEGRDVDLLPQHAARLLYRYSEFKKISQAIAEAKLTGFTSIPLLISRLIGEHLALKQVTDAGVIPKMYWEHHITELTKWREWADVLVRGASDAEKRQNMEDAVVLNGVWTEWAKRALGVIDTTDGPPTETGLMTALHGLLNERAAWASEGVQDRLGAAFAERDRWFMWAQDALGLSGAYVEEQKLSADDLRRMIRERL